MQAQHYRLFAQNDLFGLLTEEQIGRIETAGQVVRLRRGEILFQRGDPARGLYLLARGKIKLGITSAHGYEKVIRIVSAGDILCEESICLDKPLPVYALSVTDVEAVFLPRSLVLAMLEDNAALSRKLLQGLSSRMHELFYDIEAIALQSGTERLVRYLLQVSQDNCNARRLTLPASKVTIASLLNLTPETFSRTMTKLQKAGLIEIFGKEIALDIDALKAMA